MAYLMNSIYIIFILFLATFQTAISCYTSIFSFGDSLADTGNLFNPSTRKNPLYGMTYFRHPSGRFSNGRIVVDFLAQAFNLPLLPPYHAMNGIGDFKQGANFAVGGANALSNSFFEGIGINVSWIDYSLTTQIGWFKHLRKQSIFSEKLLSNSLFVIGEMGLNDYENIIIYKDGQHMKSFVPPVIEAISSAVNDLIKLGATNIMVTGMVPLGCLPSMLTYHKTQNVDAYDSKTGCLKWWNSFAKYHNFRLQNELHKLNKLHPHAKIIYGDFYGANMRIFHTPKKFGIKVSLAACCGGGGLYNLNSSVICGDKMSSLCSDPSSYISWDGIHSTETTYNIIARGFLNGPYATPPLAHNCK